MWDVFIDSPEYIPDFFISTEQHKNIRLACTNKDFGKTTGITYDCPKFPVTKLIDDINMDVVEMEETSKRLGSDYYSYLIYEYPPSHHI